jgi:hypothetical protein
MKLSPDRGPAEIRRFLQSPGGAASAFAAVRPAAAAAVQPEGDLSQSLDQ